MTAADWQPCEQIPGWFYKVGDKGFYQPTGGVQVWNGQRGVERCTRKGVWLGDGTEAQAIASLKQWVASYDA